jgi:hypothetical protein
VETVLDQYTTEEHRSVVRVLYSKGLNAKDIYKEIFSVFSGKCLSRKAFHNWVEKLGKPFPGDEETDTEMRKSLRQESKDVYAAGFDALVMKWDKCIEK